MSVFKEAMEGQERGQCKEGRKVSSNLWLRR